MSSIDVRRSTSKRLQKQTTTTKFISISIWHDLRADSYSSSIRTMPQFTSTAMKSWNRNQRVLRERQTQNTKRTNSIHEFIQMNNTMRANSESNCPNTHTFSRVLCVPPSYTFPLCCLSVHIYIVAIVYIGTTWHRFDVRNIRRRRRRLVQHGISKSIFLVFTSMIVVQLLAPFLCSANTHKHIHFPCMCMCLLLGMPTASAKLETITINNK